MNKREFRRKVKEIMNTDLNGLSLDEKAAIVRQCIVDEQKLFLDKASKGKTWTDEELRLVLKTAPTKENCILLARAFHRGYGSIEQIFRWAAEDQSTVDEKRPDDAHIQRVKRIAREVGWRAS